MDEFVKPYIRYQDIYLKDDKFITNINTDDEDCVRLSMSYDKNNGSSHITICIEELEVGIYTGYYGTDIIVYISGLSLGTDDPSVDTPLLNSIRDYLSVEQPEEFEIRLKKVIRALYARYEAFVGVPLVFDNIKRAL